MIASQNTTIVLDDGAATTVERWGDEGPVMLCVHGMTSSRKSWTRLAQHYASRFRVLAYDQRGHGDSAAVSGPMTLERGIRDLENVVAAIGGADVLIGHSWGGAVAIRGGLRVASRAIAGLDPMIVQAGDTWYGEYVEELEERFKLTGSERDAATREEYSQLHPLDVDGKVHAVHSMTAEPIAKLCSENAGANWDLRYDLAGYDKPLLLAMAGREGSIVPPDVMEAVGRKHSSCVTIVTFEDQGHNVYRTDFDAVAGAIDSFLKANQLA